MRISQLQVEGFRAFGRSADLDFAADVVILVGPNGVGKTSVFDAIEWALFGSIPRLRGNRDAVGEDYVGNRFLPATPPQVSLYLSEADQLTAVRRSSQAVIVSPGDDHTLSGSAAQAFINRHVSETVGPATDAIELFERTNVLGQDRMVDFVRDTTPRKRFDSLSTLIGADVVRRFYQRCELWTEEAAARLADQERSILNQDRRLEQLRLRRLTLESSISAARSPASERYAEDIASVGSAISAIGMRDRAWDGVDLPSGIAIVEDFARQLATRAQRVDAATRQLDEIERSRDEVGKLRLALPSLRAQDHQAADASERAESAAIRGRDELRSISDGLERTRAAVTQLRSERRELARFLTLAKPHVAGDRCPVCLQRIVPTAVLRTLDERIASLPDHVGALTEEEERATAALATAKNRVEELEGAARAARTRRLQARDDLQRAESTVGEWDTKFRELTDAWATSTVDETRRDLDARRREIQLLRARCAELVSEIQGSIAQSQLPALVSEEEQASRLRTEAVSSRDAVAAVERKLRGIASDSKAAELDIVEAAISSHMPTLRALYRRLNPSPLFDTLDIRFGHFGERGEVYYRAVHGVTSGNASMMFSSAQMNAVAVSVFLALNLMHRGSSFDWVLLDDPIQNMDDYNVLGLVDLLRALRGGRQLVVSTHDVRLGELMRRKLRPVREGQRTVVHHFEAGDEGGPFVLTTTLDAEPPEELMVPVA